MGVIALYRSQIHVGGRLSHTVTVTVEAMMVVGVSWLVIIFFPVQERDHGGYVVPGAALDGEHL